MNRLKQQQCMNGKLLDPKHTGPKKLFLLYETIQHLEQDYDLNRGVVWFEFW